MSRVVYALAVGLDKGPPRPVICKTCRETTASCRCFDAWFAERVRVADGSDKTAVSHG